MCEDLRLDQCGGATNCYTHVTAATLLIASRIFFLKRHRRRITAPVSESSQPATGMWYPSNNEQLNQAVDAISQTVLDNNGTGRQVRANVCSRRNSRVRSRWKFDQNKTSAARATDPQSSTVISTNAQGTGGQLRYMRNNDETGRVERFKISVVLARQMPPVFHVAICVSSPIYRCQTGYCQARHEVSPDARVMLLWPLLSPEFLIYSPSYSHANVTRQATAGLWSKANLCLKFHRREFPVLPPANSVPILYCSGSYIKALIDL